MFNKLKKEVEKLKVEWIDDIQGIVGYRESSLK